RPRRVAPRPESNWKSRRLGRALNDTRELGAGAPLREAVSTAAHALRRRNINMYEQPPDDDGASEGGDRVPAAPPIALAVGSGRRIGRPDPQEAQLAAYSLDDARLVLRR